MAKPGWPRTPEKKFAFPQKRMKNGHNKLILNYLAEIFTFASPPAADFRLPLFQFLTMKKTAVALLFAAAFSVPAFSQKWSIQAGPVFSRFMDNDYPAPYYKRIGWQPGLMLGVRLKATNSMSIEFNFIQKGDRRTLSTFLTGRETEIQNRLSFFEMLGIWRIPFSKKRLNGWAFEPGIGLGIGFASRTRLLESGKPEVKFSQRKFNGLPVPIQLGLAKPVGNQFEWFFRTSFSFYLDPIYEALFRPLSVLNGSSTNNGLFGHVAWATGLRHPISLQKPAK